jgi:hypothetical protein
VERIRAYKYFYSESPIEKGFIVVRKLEEIEEFKYRPFRLDVPARR